MKSKSLRTIMLAAAMLLPALPAKSTVPSPLNLHFTYYVQVSSTVENGIERGEVESFRLDSKGVLKLLELETGMIFPKGSKLIIDPNGESYVVDKNGDILVGVTQYVSANFGDSLFDGFYDLATGHEKSHIFIAFLLNLNFPSDDLLLQIFGLAKEKFNASKPSQNDTQKLKGSITVDVSGQGDLDEELILGEGTVKLNGKETVELKN